jgi:hypothetical protein
MQELKDMLRMDQGDTTQDDVLTTLEVAARAWCETLTQRRFVQQTWALMMDFFPGYIDMKLAGQKVSSPFVSGSNAVLVGIRYAILLPYPPVQNLVAFVYQDANGAVADMTNGHPDAPAEWNFVLDLQSQPARLTPLFGQMWPVARVVVNAVQVNYKVGYATPMAVTTTSGADALTGGSFTQSNVGQPISIPGAGVLGGCLNTVIASVDDSGAASMRDPALTGGAATALLVTNGTPGHWELLKLAIKVLVNAWYVNRMPSFDAKARDCVKAILGPAMDLRL